MIDYIKLDVSYLDRRAINENVDLNFHDTYHRENGEVYKSIARYSNLTFTLVPTRIFIEGSLHKYYNISNGLDDQNYTQFTYEQILWVINDLKLKFGIIPERSKILNIEYGVNLEIGENPSELLKSKVKFYKFQYPNSTDYLSKGYSQVFSFAEYKIKMYDKGNQYSLGQNILRFELRTKKSRNLGGKSRIQFLADLCNVENLSSLHNDLMKRMKDIFIYDCNDPVEGMTESDKTLFVKSQSQAFFHNMKGTSKHNQATKARTKLRKILSEHNLNTVHKSLLQNLESKEYELLLMAG